MFTKKTLQVIKALQPITDTAIFTYPITGLRDSAQSIIAFIDLTKLGEEKFDTFGIYNIKSFIDIVNLVGEDSEISIDNKVLNIKSPTMSCQYITTLPELISEVAEVKMDLLKVIMGSDTIYEFELSKSSLETIKKASQILQLDMLIMQGQGNKVSLSADSSDNSNSNKFHIDVEADVQSNQAIYVNVSALKKIPLTDYICKCKFYKERGKYAIQLTPKDAPYITIIIPSKPHNK